MKDQQFLDKIRRKIQASLAESSHEQLSPAEEEKKIMDKQPIFDVAGNPISSAEFCEKAALVWAELSVHTRASTTPLTTQVTEDEGMVTAVVTWYQNGEEKQVESFFRLQPSPYFGWDIVQTSLMDDILALG